MSTLATAPPATQAAHRIQRVFCLDCRVTIHCQCGWISHRWPNLEAAALQYDLHIRATAQDASQSPAGSPGEDKSNSESAPCLASVAARDLNLASNGFHSVASQHKEWGSEAASSDHLTPFQVPGVGSPASRDAGDASECLSRVSSPESAGVASVSASASNRYPIDTAWINLFRSRK